MPQVTQGGTVVMDNCNLLLLPILDSQDGCPAARPSVSVTARMTLVFGACNAG